MLNRKQTCLDNIDLFDMKHYDETLMQSPRFQQMEVEGCEILPTFPSLQRDLWASFYKYAPKISPLVEKDLTINKEILHKLFNNSEFQGMREYTKLDDLASALTTINMSSELNQIIQKINTETEELKKQMQEAQKKSEEHQAKQEAIQQQLEDLQQKIHQEQQNGDQEKLDELTKKEQSFKKKEAAAKRSCTMNENKANQLQQQIQQQAQQILSSPSMHQQLSTAITRTYDKSKSLIEEVNLISGDSWGTGTGNLSKSELLNKLDLAEALKKNSQLRHTLKLAGKMKMIAMKKQKEKTQHSTLKQSVELGSNPERLLPTELLMYNNPATKRVFLQRYAEGQCQQYSTREKEKLGKGPVVCCVDISGSMSDPLTDEAKRSEWAKAVAFALWTIAQKQKRPFYLIEFNYSVVTSQKILPSDLQLLLRVSADGGTSFQQPLEESLRVIKSEAKFKKADIIFITDGSCRVDGSWLNSFEDKKKKLKLSVYSIQVASTADISGLKGFSDEIVRFDGSNEYTKVFGI